MYVLEVLIIQKRVVELLMNDNTDGCSRTTDNTEESSWNKTDRYVELLMIP